MTGLHRVVERDLEYTSWSGLTGLADLVAPNVPMLVADLALPFLAACETERRAAGFDDAIAARIETFNQRLSACPGTTVPSAASLMASAWLDDRAGISGALDANWWNPC